MTTDSHVSLRELEEDVYTLCRVWPWKGMVCVGGRDLSAVCLCVASGWVHSRDTRQLSAAACGCGRA